MVCDKVVCERWCVTKWRVKDGVRASPVSQVPRLPRTVKVDVAKQSDRRPRKVARCYRRPSAPKCAQACHQSRPRAISAMPATQNEGGSHQGPRLPHQTKVDVTKCHTCHAKVAWRHWRPSAPPEPAQCHKCHACHAKRRYTSPSATPATRNEGGCHQVPRLPRKVPRRHRRPSAPKRATRAS